MGAGGDKLKSARNGVVLVTGASSGIGKAIALELARDCQAMVLTGRSEERLEAVRSAVEAFGAETVVVPADLADRRAVERLNAAVKQRFTRMDVLVMAGGAMTYGRFEDQDVSELAQLFAVNVIGPITLLASLLPLLKNSRGQVVFINSSIVFNPSQRTAYYAATKCALKGLAEGIRQEVNQEGIRVLNVYPGRTATPLQEWLHRLEGRTYRPGELLQPEDIAGAVVHALEAPATAEITDIFVRPAIKNSDARQFRLARSEQALSGSDLQETE